jgi:hypothetical protein
MMQLLRTSVIVSTIKTDQSFAPFCVGQGTANFSAGIGFERSIDPLGFALSIKALNAGGLPPEK